MAIIPKGVMTDIVEKGWGFEKNRWHTLRFENLEPHLGNNRSSSIRSVLMSRDDREIKGKEETGVRLTIYRNIMADYSKVVGNEKVFFHRRTGPYFWRTIQPMDYYLFWDKKSNELARVKLTLTREKNQPHEIYVETGKFDNDGSLSEYKEQHFDLDEAELPNLASAGLFEYLISKHKPD